MASVTWREDLKALLDGMDSWARQRAWRLVREPPLTREEVDALPRLLSTSTDLISFADAHLGVEAARWCF